MIHRHLTPALEEAARDYPAITLTGPRQSGKTTLVRATFPDHLYISLELPHVREEALADPRGLLARADRVILDEIQRAPDLLSYVQVLVDEDPTPGRFVVTGSQNILLMESVSQTLAGRTAILHLHPLSVAELRGRPDLDPRVLDRAGTEGGQAVVEGATMRVPTEDIWDMLARGFYPPVHDRRMSHVDWLSYYIRTYVERDLREVMKVADLRSFDTFIRLAAARTGTELNLSALASDVGVGQQTVRRWISALEIGHLAVLLRPHHANFRKRMRKRPRLHFLDPGLVCVLLGIHDGATLAGHPLRGAIFESFVVSELVKAFAVLRRDPPLFFWRDATGHEIDIVIDLGDRLVPVEVKSGQTVASDAFRGLDWWTALPGNPNSGGVLVHGGTERFSTRGYEVRPWWIG